MAALVVGAVGFAYSTALYEMLFEAPEEDVVAACADAIQAEAGVEPLNVTAQYVDTEAWIAQGTVPESGQAVVYQCRVSEGSFNRLSVERVTREG